MTERTRRWINAGLAMLLLAAGAGGAALLVRSRPQPVRLARPDDSPHVVVVPVVRQTFTAPVIGHGTVKPKRSLPIVPQVSGRLTEVHPDLGEGKLVKKGELLFEIDPRTYESHVRQVEADVRRLELQRERQVAERASIERRLEVARQQLALAESKLEREQGFLTTDKPSTTILAVELAQTEQLKAKDAVVDLESRLGLVPHVLAETDAALDARRAALEEAKLNVERTRIYCPFDARVDAILAQESQVVVTAFQIATLTDMEAFEIPAVIDPRDLRWTDRRAYARLFGDDIGAPPEVKVTWTMLGERLSWSGKVTRLQRHDEATRTARVVVEVENIEFGRGDIDDPSRPVLAIGMFCRAEIPAEPLDDALVVPRSAITSDDTVYVFVPDGGPDSSVGHLESRRVPLLRTVGDEVLVAFEGNDELPARDDDAGLVCELQPNELVIASPLPRAVNGMRLVRRGATASGHTQPEALAQMPDAHTTPLNMFAEARQPLPVSSLTVRTSRR